MRATVQMEGNKEKGKRATNNEGSTEEGTKNNNNEEDEEEEEGEERPRTGNSSDLAGIWVS